MHPHKQQLLDEFAGYLERSDFDDDDFKQQPDLNSLLTEMVGLKTEVKTESRHLKTMLDQFTVSLETLQQDNQALTQQLHDYKARLAKQKHDIERKMIAEILDLYDRLSAGLQVLQNYRPVNALFNHSKKQDTRYIKSLREGQQLTVQRLEQILQSYQVRPIETGGKVLDPHLMVAMATVRDKQLPPGAVVEELRKGFYYREQILRLAEVKVNKPDD